MMERRARKRFGIPILKLPPARLRVVLSALHNHEYDREGFRLDVLQLFPGKSEKSVFRGMAIPTLRAFGFLVGFEREMRLSGDGALVSVAFQGGRSSPNRPLQRLLCVLEKEHKLDSVWHRGHIDAGRAAEVFAGVETSPTVSSDFPGTVRRWLQYLEFFGVIDRKGNRFGRVLSLSSRELRPLRSVGTFVSSAMAAYRRVAKGAVGEPVISIEVLHRELAVYGWSRHQTIVLRSDFDSLLRRALDSRLIDAYLHRSMGAEQRLFEFRGVYYQAISLRES